MQTNKPRPDPRDHQTLSALYGALQAKDLSLHDVADAFFDGDCLDARESLQELSSRDLVYERVVSAGVRQWMVKDRRP